MQILRLGKWAPAKVVVTEGNAPLWGKGAMTAAKSIAMWSNLPNLNSFLATKRAEGARPQKVGRQAKEKKPRGERVNVFSLGSRDFLWKRSGDGAI